MTARRRRSRQRGAAGKNLAGVALIVGAILLIGGAILWATLSVRNGPHLDKVTLCDRRGPTAVTAILVDATDPVGPVQRLAVVDRVAQIVKGLGANERVEIYEIRPDQDLLAPDFAKCRPAAPEEVSELSGNRRLAKERFDEDFGAALKRVLDASLDRTASLRSPIMEAIQAAGVRAFSAPDLQSRAPGFRRQLVVISDMMQNSAAGSHYQGVPDFAAFKASPAFAKYASDLRGVSVTLLYLRKDDGAKIQGRSHVEFWNQWFAAQGASVDDVVGM